MTRFVLGAVVCLALATAAQAQGPHFTYRPGYPNYQQRYQHQFGLSYPQGPFDRQFPTGRGGMFPQNYSPPIYYYNNLSYYSSPTDFVTPGYRFRTPRYYYYPHNPPAYDPDHPVYYGGYGIR
jgi:hypothetical protein